MFTGVIECTGEIISLSKKTRAYELKLSSRNIASSMKLGESLSVNGICLTVTKVISDEITLEIMPETLGRTNLGGLKAKNAVNLERALRVNGRIDGHFVTGHVDATGILTSRRTRGQDVVLEVGLPIEFLRYIVSKSSVALDGVSLTVSAVKSSSFEVSLIPYTLDNCTLGTKKTGDILNVECDILAKYIEKLYMGKGSSQGSLLSESFLKEHGFI